MSASTYNIVERFTHNVVYHTSGLRRTWIRENTHCNKPFYLFYFSLRT